ncbi:hypothetical protein HX063_16955, partial [Myroides odoratimimus]|uniref:hypothetical protein n=1 Tax=Myroides odoratimimus TaxID=76832 RepID=UPI00257519B2
TVTTFVANGDGTYTYTSEDGTSTVVKPLDYNYTIQETGRSWINNKSVFELVADITLTTKTNAFTLPTDIPQEALIIGIRFINKMNGSISTNVLKYDNVTRELVLGIIGSLTVYHPAGDYYLIVEYVESK